MIAADPHTLALRQAAARLRGEADRLEEEAAAIERVRSGLASILDDLVPIALVAKMRDISKEGARAWAHRNKLSVSIDGRIYVKASDL